MSRGKNTGFTLSETLITLSIIGVIAVLVLPGLITSSLNKSRIALAQNTAGEISTVVQTRVANQGAANLEDSEVMKSDFFYKNMQVVKTSGSGYKAASFASSYKSLNGGSASVTTGNVKSSAKLKSGASVSVNKDSYTTSEGNETAYTLRLDVNSDDGPNVVGVDYFEMEVNLKNVVRDSSDSRPDKHIGEVSAYEYGRSSTVASQSGDCNKIKKARTECMAGNPKVCYYLLETEGFDIDYIKNANECSEE